MVPGRSGMPVCVAPRRRPWDTSLEVAAVRSRPRGTVRAGTTLGFLAEDRLARMTLLLAAVGATLMALLETSVGPYLQIFTAQPHLVLVVGIVVTVAVGLEAGLVWAFVGGLVLDVVVQRPLGSTSFALLLCMGATAVMARLFVRFRLLVPILATAVLSLAYSMILFIAFNALHARIPVQDPIDILLPGLVYDTVLAALIGPLAVSVHDRRIDPERIDW